MPISKVGAIVPDDDSDTEGFAPRDIIETDADIQRHAEVGAGCSRTPREQQEQQEQGFRHGG